MRLFDSCLKVRIDDEKKKKIRELHTQYVCYLCRRWSIIYLSCVENKLTAMSTIVSGRILCLDDFRFCGPGSQALCARMCTVIAAVYLVSITCICAAACVSCSKCLFFSQLLILKTRHKGSRTQPIWKQKSIKLMNSRGLWCTNLQREECYSLLCTHV